MLVYYLIGDRNTNKSLYTMDDCHYHHCLYPRPRIIFYIIMIKFQCFQSHIDKVIVCQERLLDLEDVQVELLLLCS
jgi:hypothetical protein